MINNWVEAIGDTDPRWQAGEAPPAMAQVWTMGGLHPKRDPDDPLHSMMTVLDRGRLHRRPRHQLRAGRTPATCGVGEEVTVTTRLESVVGPKQTGVGEGYFVTTRNVWRVGDEAGRVHAVPGAQVRPEGAGASRP